MKSSCLKYLSTPKLPTLLLEFLICKDKMPSLWVWVAHTKAVSRAISLKNTDMILNFGKPSKLLCSQSKVLGLAQVSMKTYIMFKETMLCTMMLRVLQQKKLSLFLMTQQMTNLKFRNLVLIKIQGAHRKLKPSMQKSSEKIKQKNL